MFHLTFLSEPRVHPPLKKGGNTACARIVEASKISKTPKTPKTPKNAGRRSTIKV
jgi:hypothetical protein